jgi:hypothetical protein
MRFKEMLENMLEAIEVDDRDSSKVICINENAYFWTAISETSYWDPMLEKIIMSGHAFSELREREVAETLREVLLNSRKACEDKGSERIRCDGYIGAVGVIYHIADSGPGFDVTSELKRVKSIEAPPTDEKLLREIPGGRANSGNGMMFLQRFSTEYSYSKKGNQVALRFNYKDR